MKFPCGGDDQALSNGKFPPIVQTQRCVAKRWYESGDDDGTCFFRPEAVMGMFGSGQRYRGPHSALHNDVLVIGQTSGALSIFGFRAGIVISL